MTATTNFRAVTGLAAAGSGGSSGPSVWAFPNAPAPKTANYTLTTSDGAIKFNASAQSLTATLPSAATCYANGMGQVFTIKKVDASENLVMIQAVSGQMIDGFTSITINLQYDSVTVQSTGTGWDVISSN